MTTPTKNEQYIGKIVIKGVEEVSVFGPTLTDTIIELNRYIEQYKLQGPMDIAVYKEGFKDPLAIVEQEGIAPTKEQVIEVMREAVDGVVYPISTIELVTKCIIAWEKIRGE